MLCLGSILEYLFLCAPFVLNGSINTQPDLQKPVQVVPDGFELVIGFLMLPFQTVVFRRQLFHSVGYACSLDDVFDAE